MNKDLYDILNIYGFIQPLEIKPIFKDATVWNIDNKYILKKNNEEENDIEKALMINNFLIKENISVVEYVKTVAGEYYVVFRNNIYSLMRKINGEHINPATPFSGDYKTMAHHIGVEIARLHKALAKIEKNVVYESCLMNELQMHLKDIKSNNIEVPCEIINFCLAFDSDYYLLPKQIIHRDIHTGNMLFENDRLVSFLDFDSCQVNARIFDIVYLGQSMLFIGDNYKNAGFVEQWSEFFTSLLHGYQLENELYENELKAIHKLCLVIQLGFISYYLPMKKKRELIPNRIDIAKWIYANKKIFTFNV